MNSCVCVLICLSLIWLFATLWTVALQAPLSKRFSRQEYWSGFCHFLLQGIIWPRDRTRDFCLVGGFFTTEPSRKPISYVMCAIYSLCLYWFSLLVFLYSKSISYRQNVVESCFMIHSECLYFLIGVLAY